MTNPYITQQSGGGDKTPSPVSSNPYSSQDSQIIHSPNESDKDSFGYKLGNFYNYIKSAMDQPGETFSGSRMLQGAKQIGNNVGSDINDIINYWKNTGFKQVGKDIGGLVGKSASDLVENNPLSPSGLGHLVSGIPSSMLDMIQKPVEAVVGMTNDNGVAKPSSPEEQARNIQSSVGIAAMFLTQAKLSKMMLPEVTGASSIAELEPARIGRIGLGAMGKNAAKVIGANSASGAIAGGVSGAIGGIGQDNQADQIIGSALSFVPLAVAMGVFNIKPRYNKLVNEKGKYISEQNNASTLELAALNSMRVDPSDPVSVLAGKINGLTNKDDLVTAAIHDKLDQGDGYIVEGISEDFGKMLHEKLNPSLAEKPNVISRKDATLMKSEGKGIPKGTYVPPVELTNMKGGPFGTEVKFEDPFDKLAYYAANPELSKHVQNLLDDAVEQTGLSETEIKSHGEFVRKTANEAVKSQKLTPRTQPEIDEANNKSLIKGSQIAQSTPIGGKIVDNGGVEWTKIDDNSITDGKLTLPLNENTTLQRIGRNPSESYLYNAYANLPSQEFKPNFNRDATGDVRYYHSPSTGNLLVAKEGSIGPVNIQRFIKNGFVPREIVSLNGQEVRVDGFNKDGSVNVKDANGILSNVDSKALRRTNNSLQLQEVKDSRGRIATLSPESYADELYKDYISQFNNSISSNSPETYSSFYQKFFSDHKINPNDYNNLHTYFLGKLGDDIAGQVLKPEEVTVRKALMEDIRETANKQVLDINHSLNNLATSNGLFFSAEGGGIYRLRHMSDGSTYKTVGSLEEVNKAINEIRQSKGQDLDGGYSGSMPTGIGNLGGLASSYSPIPNSKWSQVLDHSRAFGILKNITPVGQVLQKVDNITGTNLYEKFLGVQNKLIEKSNLISRDPALNDLNKDGQRIMDLGGTLSANDRAMAGDNLEALSLDQIKSGKYIGRPSTPFEEALAKEVVKSGNVGGVKSLLYNTKMIDPKTVYGSSAWRANFDIASKDFRPEVVSAAKQFALMIAQDSKMSGNLILKLASAMENPDIAMDADSHARVNNLNPKVIQYKNSLNDWYVKAGKILGIDATKAYLPNILNAMAGGEDSPLPEGVANEISKSGIVPGGSLVRDPNVLVSRYFSAVLNHKVGFHDAINDFEDSSLSELTKLQGTEHDTAIPGLKARIGDYARMIRGQPTAEDQLHNATRQVAEQIGLGTPSINSVMSTMSLADIALRPMLAVRDFHNIAGASYISYGAEFAKNFLMNSTSDAVVADMKRRNLLPESSARKFVDPSSSGDLLSQGSIGQGLRKASEKSFNLSGQEAAYEHANASIYRTSLDMGEKYLNKLQRNEITKTEAYDKLGFHNLGPAVTKVLDDYISQGQIEQATDLYGQANMRYLSHVYGFYNNPMGWNSNFGRLLGQWGSWSANASSTMLDQFSKGTKSQIAGKILRTSIWNGATIGVGSAIGLNLGSWAVSNPLTVWPGVGPVVGMIGNLKDDAERGKLSLGSSLWRASENFIPYSAFARGWVSGLEKVGQGQLLTGLMGGLGAPMAK